MSLPGNGINFFITVPVSPLYFHPNVRKKERRHALVTWKKTFHAYRSSLGSGSYQETLAFLSHSRK
jgi:hypothetical protein